MTTEDKQATTTLQRAEARRRRHLLRTDAYWVHLDLSEASSQGTFLSETALEFSATSAGETFLDCLAEEVVSVELNGQQLPVEEVVTPGRIRLAGLAAGENRVRIVARMAYSHSGEGLHRFRDTADSRLYLYTQFEPSDARRVFACFDQPDLKARFHISVTAPTGWEVRSNSPAARTVPGREPVTTTTFHPTEPISSYLVCVLAGDYHLFADEWTDGTQRIPLGVLVRQSQREDCDPEEIFQITKQGLDYFHAEFQVRYPWGKYDQAFVPEYNLGAMENPGLVTFTDQYIFRDAVTRSRRESRANTILHEMAHMWFGNLVTMRWWDDLWLKESFADYMASRALTEATEHREAWTTFASRRKAWAYRQDLLPTTHPIVADVPDVEAAKLNFDGITYAKGASVVKQLAAWVGPEAFTQGVRHYFAQHAWGNTTLEDFLGCLAQAAPDRSLDAWARDWLASTGISRLTPVISDRDGVITHAVIEQSSVSPDTGEDGPLRPHRIAIGLYERRTRSGRLQRSELLEVDVSGRTTHLDMLIGRRRPALILVNDEDYSYAQADLDPVSTRTAREELSALDSPMARGLIWSQLWMQVREGTLLTSEYLQICARHLAAERDPSLAETLRGTIITALDSYLPRSSRRRCLSALISAALDAVLSAAPGSDQQHDGMRLLVELAARTTSRLRDGQVSPSEAERAAVEVVEAVLSLPVGEDLSAHSTMGEFRGVTIDHGLRWKSLLALVGLGRADAEDIALEWAKDATSTGRLRARELDAAIPLPIVKSRVFEAVTRDAELSNDTLSAMLSGWASPGGRHLLEPYAVMYFDQLGTIWAERSIEMARRLVVGLYPHWTTRPAMAAGLAESWLNEHPEAPAALRRLVIEAADESLRRALLLTPSRGRVEAATLPRRRDLRLG